MRIRRLLDPRSRRLRRHESNATAPTGPTNPTPDPDDDDDFAKGDQQIYWGGGQHNLGTPITLALGDATRGKGPKGVGDRCYAALLGTSEEKTLAPMATSSSNAKVLRQVARLYQSDGGGTEFATFLLTAKGEAYAGGGSQKAWIIDHLYYALLDQNQYDGLQTDSPAHAAAFKTPSAWHHLLTFNTPAFNLADGSVSGELKAAKKSLSGDAIRWLDLKVSLLGVVGTEASSGTPITWSRTGDTAESGTGIDWITYEYGGGGGTQALRGSSPRAEGNAAAFVVGWGRYKDVATGTVHWAVSVPENCDVVGVGDPYAAPVGGGGK